MTGDSRDCSIVEVSIDENQEILWPIPLTESWREQLNRTLHEKPLTPATRVGSYAA